MLATPLRVIYLIYYKKGFMKKVNVLYLRILLKYSIIA